MHHSCDRLTWRRLGCSAAALLMLLLMLLMLLLMLLMLLLMLLLTHVQTGVLVLLILRIGVAQLRHRRTHQLTSNLTRTLLLR